MKTELILVIVFLVIDKVVALSPWKWDDLIWTSIKKSFNFFKKGVK